MKMPVDERSNDRDPWAESRMASVGAAACQCALNWYEMRYILVFRMEVVLYKSMGCMLSWIPFTHSTSTSIYSSLLQPCLLAFTKAFHSSGGFPRPSIFSNTAYGSDLLPEDRKVCSSLIQAYTMTFAFES